MTLVTAEAKRAAEAEEKRLKHNEAQRRYKERKKLESYKNFDDSDAEIMEDPATVAARINQKFGFTKICAEGHSRNTVAIVEYLNTRNYDGPEKLKPFRLKVTEYFYFRTLNAAVRNANAKKIRLKITSDETVEGEV